MGTVLDVTPAGVRLSPFASAIPDNICRVPFCQCAHHRALDFELLEAYGIDWRHPSPGQRRLTPNEARLLALLLPPGRLVRHDELLVRAWGASYANDRDTERANRHLLRVNASRLRQKLGERWLLVTLAGVGMRLTVPVGQHGT